MGIFDFLKNKKPKVLQGDVKGLTLAIQGPTYLRNMLQRATRQVEGFSKFHPETQFVGKLVTEFDSRFHLKYYGELSPGGLIMDQDETPMKVVAIGAASGNETVLFDKCLHGWEGFVTGAFQDDQLKDRSPDRNFQVDSISSFQIYLVAHYNPGTQSELVDESVDGVVEIASGKKLALQEVFDDAFDVIEIFGIDDNGRVHSIVAEELA